MIVKAPRWKGTGLGKVRGLGQTMGPTDIGPVDPETGVPLYSTVDSLQQALANLSFNQLTSVLDPFLASGNIYTGTTPSALSTALSPSSISGTTLAIIGGVLLFVILFSGPVE